MAECARSDDCHRHCSVHLSSMRGDSYPDEAQHVVAASRPTLDAGSFFAMTRQQDAALPTVRVFLYRSYMPEMDLAAVELGVLAAAYGAGPRYLSTTPAVVRDRPTGMPALSTRRPHDYWNQTRRGGRRRY